MCSLYAYAGRPYIQVFNALKLSADNSKDEVRWKIPTHIEPPLALWIKESIRVIKANGKLDCIIEGIDSFTAYCQVRHILTSWSISKCLTCGEIHIEAYK